MRVTRVIREYIEEKVAERLPYPEKTKGVEIDEFDNFEKKLVEEVIGKYTAYITDNFDKIRVDARWGMGDKINDILAVKECVIDRIYKPHLAVFSVARKEYDQECQRIREERVKAVKEITISLELGGTKAELEEMLAKVGV